MSEEKNMPEQKFSAGAVSATVWKNQTEKNGSVFDFRTISFERRYKDKEGKWQSSNSFRINDLPKARLVLDKAYEYLIMNKSQEGEDQ